MLIVNVFLALALVVFLGSILIYLFPDMQIDKIRQGINKLVLMIFLPALNFNVIYSAQIGHEFWQLPLIAFIGVFVALGLGICLYTLLHEEPKKKGALVFGCAFSNVTYFGIAVLQGLFPNNLVQALEVAILFEITITPLNLVVGAALASHYGEGKFSLRNSLVDVCKMPLLWTTFIALFFNLYKVPMPHFIINATTLLASAVSGLMILSLGMALKYPILLKAFRRFHIFFPVLLVKLILLPIVTFLGLKWLGVTGLYFLAAILEAAMPTQLFSLAVADRFDLDIEMLAIAISIDTAISFVTLPAVHAAVVYLTS